MPHILIIDDEKDIVEAVSYNLKKESYKVSKAYDGEIGLKLVKNKKPDLIILDLMLPGISGLDVCREVKKSSNIPIIMLTARGEEVDKVVGLELGADDYITKPFGIRELIARIKTILKRYKGREEGSMKFPDLEIDIERHLVLVSKKEIELTAKEFELLRYLVENKGKPINRERLLDQVWGIEVAIETRTVDVHVTRLREKLKKAGKYIKTLHGVGYKFDI